MAAIDIDHCHPWAETTPWECLIRETGCCSPTHNHSPMVNDPCAHPGCIELLVADESCYAVIEIETTNDGSMAWVCWRHVVRPVNEHDELMTGPITGRGCT